jgi:acyl carrier protein
MNNKKRIFKVMKSALNEKNVDVTTSQKNTNQWDSLKHLSLVVELEIEFNIEFEPDEIAKMTDYTKIEEYINEKI